ncbi:MAG: hypothetical protein E6922_01215 [Veillonella sp.]|jgi:hypothetical protein|nr:hypothetical protein [Veillonella sp.]MDU1415197.1 hypothetical protein [Veillonella sp.]
MFIAGIIAAGVAGTIGVIAHSDHSDYSDYYSDYSDYAEKERKRKQAELYAKENELKQLKQQLENECNQALETIKLELQENKYTAGIDPKIYNLVSKDGQNKLKRDIESKLMASLDEDRAALMDINDTLKRINEIQLKVKKDIKVNK